MNVINSFFLYLILLPSGIYKRLGVDVTKLKSILTCKLIMDDRQPFSLNLSQQKQAKEPVSDSTYLAMGIYSLIGLFLIGCFYFGENLILQFTLFFSIYLVMLTLTLVVDFTRVLIDVRDNFIVLPKPVNDRTFLISRILHITIHISKMSTPLFLPSTIFLAFRYGLVGMGAFLVATFLATLFSIFLINASYLGILRFSKPEKFKSIISYLQIGFTIAIYGGYQLLPRFINMAAVEEMDFNKLNWINLVPPYWFAALWQTLHNPLWNTNLILGTLLAIGMPLAGIYLVVKVFAPAFNKKLTLLMGTGDSTGTMQIKKIGNTNFGDIISSWFTKPGPEQMGFDLSWRMMLRSRDFKMQVYPAIGYILVLFVAFNLKEYGIRPDSFNMDNPENKLKIVFLLYAPALMVLIAASQLHNSQSWKASWIYKMSTVKNPGKIIIGSLKAASFQFMVIPIAIIGGLGLAINGAAFLPALFMALSVQILMVYLVNYIYAAYLPFSQPLKGSGDNGTTTLKGILGSLLLAVLAGIQWFISSNVWYLFAGGCMAILLTWLIHKKLARTPWHKISFANEPL